jgi:hypothetical protein
VILEAMQPRTEYTIVQIHALVMKTGLSLKQVQSCVYNLKSDGALESSDRTGNKASPTGGNDEKTYRLSGSAPRRRATGAKAQPPKVGPKFASVFHYAQGIEA